MQTKIATILIFALVTACGAAHDEQGPKKNEEPKTTADGTKTEQGWGAGAGAAAALDEEIYGEEASAQVDDAVAAAAEDSEADQGGALGLGSSFELDLKAKRFRECKVEDGKAKVDISREIELTREFDLKVRKGFASFKNDYEKQRTWAKAGAELVCADNGKHVLLSFEEMQGVSLDVSFKHVRSRTLHVENKKTGRVQDRSAAKIVTGTRHAEWGAVATADGFTTLEKTVRFSGERKLTAQGKDGKAKESIRSVTTAEGAPLAITVKRSATDGEIVERLIKSGKVVATGKDGGRLETSFTNVLYKRETGCVAASGKIEGSIFAPGATTATLGYVIDLDEGKIVYSDGREVDYASEGCDLDEPADIQEAASKDEIVAG